MPGTASRSSGANSANCSTVVMSAEFSFLMIPGVSPEMDSNGVAAWRRWISSSISARFSSSLLMSMRQPINFDASRTFCPFFPIASDNWLSSTMISMIRSGGGSTSGEVGSYSVSDAARMDTRLTCAGLIALVANVTTSSDHWMMSIFSPRSSRMMDWTRLPLMPTHAPTGSTSRSLEATAILVRSPDSRAMLRICTVPS